MMRDAKEPGTKGRAAVSRERCQCFGKDDAGRVLGQLPATQTVVAVPVDGGGGPTVERSEGASIVQRTLDQDVLVDFYGIDVVVIGLVTKDWHCAIHHRDRLRIDPSPK